MIAFKCRSVEIFEVYKNVVLVLWGQLEQDKIKCVEVIRVFIAPVC